MITVKSIDNTTFEVVVEGTKTTTHRVTVPLSYYEKLTKKRVAPDVLVERSFKFLLQRESNASILKRFELSEISRYFPEYEKTIQGMLE
jgi:hypothetical protein